MVNIITDRTGFPLLYVGAIDAYVHWIPITKVQFEYFICDNPSTHFDEGWYQEVLALNPRLSYTRLASRHRRSRTVNYWELFLTGINPEEIHLFCEWNEATTGKEFWIPTELDWRQLYQFLTEQESILDIEELFNNAGVSARALSVLKAADNASKSLGKRNMPRSLAHQMLMSQGVMEWVACEEGRNDWGGMGNPDSNFQSIMRSPDGPTDNPRDPGGRRLRHYGFRLIVPAG